MRRLFFEEILLLSHSERTGRRLELHPRATVIKGENDTGKSSIIKSLYWTLGAEPAQQHPRWRQLAVRGLLHFRIDDERYSILRNDNVFALFDSNGQLLRRCRSVTEELAPQLGAMLDFRLTLIDRKNVAVVPPPAFMFAPFYVDQDLGWTRSLSSFGRLGQFAGWQQPITEYYAGVRSNAFYEAKAEITRTERELVGPQAKLAALKLSARLVREAYPPAFEIDVASYKTQIDELVMAAQALQSERESARQKLAELSNSKLRVLSQVEIVKRVAREIDKDYEFAAHGLDDERVDCPLCGAEYENDFRVRFDIAQDLGRCAEFELTLNDELAAIVKRMADVQSEVDVLNVSYQRARALLAEKQNRVTLRDLISNEARRKVDDVLRTDLEACTSLVAEIERRQSEAKSALKEAEDSKRRKQIMTGYLDLMAKFLYELDVQTLEQRAYAKLYSRIAETGSDLPRALLAYQFAILKLASAGGTHPFCPIVIDSPNQQDQDPVNYRRMLSFIARTADPAWQLVLGTVKDLDQDFGGAVLDLGDRKYGAMRGEQYGEVAELMQPFIRAAVEG